MGSASLPRTTQSVAEGRLSRRHAIRDNLLGDKAFCPVVRRTEAVRVAETLNFTRRCHEVVEGYSEGLLRRAVNYLYLKETRSSFEIEQVKPTQQAPSTQGLGEQDSQSG